MNGLPGLRLLPDASRPGRSHRTHRPRSAQALQRPGQGKRGGASGAFHTGYKCHRSAQLAAAQGDQDQGPFPNEDAARKLVYLALQNAVPQWTRTRAWTKALLAFKIQFGDRLPRQCNLIATTRQPSTQGLELTTGQSLHTYRGYPPIVRPARLRHEAITHRDAQFPRTRGAPTPPSEGAAGRDGGSGRSWLQSTTPHGQSR
jgi:hypothetical protein